MSLCLICLRTNTTLKIASETIKEFHEELLILSDVSTVTMSSPCYYCNECGYLLAKFYKFKQKCIKAQKIYENWKSTVMRKKQQPLTVLHTLLPPSSLGTWNNFDKMAVICVQAPNTHMLCVDTKSMNNTNIQEKQECNQTDNTNYISKIGNKNISKNDSKSDQLDKIKNCTENVEQILSDKCEELSGDEAESINDNSNDSSTTSCIYKDKTKSAENNDGKDQELLMNLEELSGDEGESINDNGNDSSTKSCIYKDKAQSSENNDGKEQELFFNLEELSGDNVVEIMNDDYSNIILIVKDETDNSSKETKILNEDSSDSYVTLKKSPCKEESLHIKTEYYGEVKRNDTNYESVFDIEYLTTLEMKLDEFNRRKTYECYVKAKHKCEICYQTFKNLKILEYHIKKWHTEQPGLVCCPICNIWSINAATHKHLHTVVFKCKLCPLVTCHRTSMTNHYQQHKGVKHTCKECKRVFASVSSFRSHMSYRHARDHVCTSCGQAYRTRAGLQIHISREHQIEGTVTDLTVKCDQCSLSFASSEAYDNHTRVTHKRVIRGRPPGTTVQFGSDRSRKRPVITCRVCNSVGGSWGWLSLHFSLEHPTLDLEQTYADKHQHLCDICGKSFSKIYTLKEHLNVHSGVRPFACESCNARFHRSNALHLHRLVHRPPSKPCAFCGKKFRSHSNLHNHMRSHIGDRRYKCNICGKGFIRRNLLNEHIRGVHKNIRRVRKRGVTDGTTRSLTLERSH